MATEVYGKKKRMTQAFRENGDVVNVTILEVEPNLITAVRTTENDGYDAVQLGFGQVDSSKVNRPHAGQFAKLDAPPRRNLREVRDMSGEVGETVGVDVFGEGERVHVSSTSKGRGFQGTVKRHNFSRGPETHGSHNVRLPGAAGVGAQTPGRILPGRKQPGQTGNKSATVRNLQVVNVDAERGEIWVRGGVPGAKNSVVRVRKAGD